MKLFDKIQSYNMLFIHNLPNIISSGYFSAAKVGKPHMGIGRLSIRAIPVMVRILPCGWVHCVVPSRNYFCYNNIIKSIKSLYYHKSHRNFDDLAQFPHIELHNRLFKRRHQLPRTEKSQIATILGIGCNRIMLRHQSEI